MTDAMPTPPDPGGSGGRRSLGAGPGGAAPAFPPAAPGELREELDGVVANTAEPGAVERDAVAPDAVERDAVAPDAAEPDAFEPVAGEPPTGEPLTPAIPEPEPAPLGVARTPTGNADVDAALGRLADADELTTDGHVAVYEDAHGQLRDALEQLDRQPGPPPPAPDPYRGG